MGRRHQETNEERLEIDCLDSATFDKVIGPVLDQHNPTKRGYDE